MQRKWIGPLCLVVTGWITASARADDWPQWLGPQRDGIWREQGILKKFPDGGPKITWRAKIGLGYSGPVVADGKVVVTDRILAEGERNPANPFDVRPVKGNERVVCLDQKTGKVLWTHEYDCTYEISYPNGPRATPAIADGKVYTFGAMGDVRCLDFKTGKLIWSKNVTKDYDARVPQWGFSSSPLVDGDLLICLVGGKGSAVVAFDKDTGKEAWKALTTDEAKQGYCPPMIYEAGGTRQLIIWHPESINGLDPKTGKAHWSVPFRVKANLTAPTPRMENNVLFVTSFYNGSMAVQLDANAPKASQLWKSKARGEGARQTTDLSSIIATPYLKDGYVYGVCSYGELRCLKAATGERVWSSLEALKSKQGNTDRWNNAFLIQHGDGCFLFTEKGELIIAQLDPKGYKELDRAKVLEPTYELRRFGGPRKVLWTHPAFAGKSMFARSDTELICVSLAAE